MVQLREARQANAVPRRWGNGLSMWVGDPGVKVRAATGDLTPAGLKWMEMGGADPRRFHPDLERRVRNNRSEYIEEHNDRRPAPLHASAAGTQPRSSTW
jgi:hypothetical protein